MAIGFLGCASFPCFYLWRLSTNHELWQRCAQCATHHATINIVWHRHHSRSLSAGQLSAYFKVLVLINFQATPTLAADMAGVIFWPVVLKLLLLLCSCRWWFMSDSSIMSNPRVYYAMVEGQSVAAYFKKAERENPSARVCFWFSGSLWSRFSFHHRSRKCCNTWCFWQHQFDHGICCYFVLRNRAAAWWNQPAFIKWPSYPWMPTIFIVVCTQWWTSGWWFQTRVAHSLGLLFLSGWPLYIRRWNEL